MRKFANALYGDLAAGVGTATERASQLNQQDKLAEYTRIYGTCVPPSMLAQSKYSEVIKRFVIQFEVHPSLLNLTAGTPLAYAKLSPEVPVSLALEGGGQLR